MRQTLTNTGCDYIGTDIATYLGRARVQGKDPFSLAVREVYYEGEQRKRRGKDSDGQQVVLRPEH